MRRDTNMMARRGKAVGYSDTIYSTQIEIRKLYDNNDDSYVTYTTISGQGYASDPYIQIKYTTSSVIDTVYVSISGSQPATYSGGATVLENVVPCYFSVSDDNISYKWFGTSISGHLYLPGVSRDLVEYSDQSSAKDHFILLCNTSNMVMEFPVGITAKYTRMYITNEHLWLNNYMHTYESNFLITGDTLYNNIKELNFIKGYRPQDLLKSGGLVTGATYRASDFVYLCGIQYIASITVHAYTDSVCLTELRLTVSSACDIRIYDGDGNILDYDYSLDQSGSVTLMAVQTVNIGADSEIIASIVGLGGVAYEVFMRSHMFKL